MQRRAPMNAIPLLRPRLRRQLLPRLPLQQHQLYLPPLETARYRKAQLPALGCALRRQRLLQKTSKDVSVTVPAMLHVEMLHTLFKLPCIYYICVTPVFLGSWMRDIW